MGGKAMKRTIAILITILIFVGIPFAHAVSRYDELQNRKDELELKITEQENLINDRNLLFVSYGPILRPVPLGDLVDYLMEMKYQGKKPEEIMGMVAAVIKNSVEYRKVVRDRVIPNIKRELQLVREEISSISPSDGSEKNESSQVSWNNMAEDDVIPWHIISEADRIISGHWVLTLNGKESIIYVTLADKNTGDFTGILTVDRLQYFQEGETVFRVKPMKDNASEFEGTEFSYDDHGGKRQADLRLSVSGREMLYESAEQKLNLHKR